MISEDYPKTLVEFDERFGTEDACRASLARLRGPEEGRQLARREVHTAPVADWELAAPPKVRKHKR